jgi:DNA-binding GntR family transcriptional regulator
VAALAVPVDIDRSSPVPLYHQLAEQLGQAIADGRLKPGDPFENEMAVAERLQLSRPTVRRAIQELVDQGLVVRRRGLGTTVANRKVHRKFQLSSLYDELVRDGRTPTTVVLDLSEQTNERAAAGLDLPTDTPLLHVTRLRLADGIPLAFMQNWLPPAHRDLTHEELERDGLYASLRARGARPVVAQQFIGARMPTTTERNRLDMPRSQPVLTMLRTAFDASGQAIEFGDHCYRASDYTIDLMVDER